MKSMPSDTVSAVRHPTLALCAICNFLGSSLRYVAMDAIYGLFSTFQNGCRMGFSIPHELRQVICTVEHSVSVTGR